MSLQTDVGVATVKQVCGVFGISRQAYYAAKQAQDEKEPPPRRGGKRAPAVAVEVLLEATIEIVDAQPAWGSGNISSSTRCDREQTLAAWLRARSRAGVS